MGVARFVHKDHDALVTDVVLSSGLGHECSASWAAGTSRSAIESAHSGWTIAATLFADAGEFAATSTAIAHDTAQNLLVAEWQNDRVSCRVLARTPAAAASLLESVRKLLPASADSVDHDVRVTFWSYSDHEAERVSWRITVPTWASVRANYHSRTRAQLADTRLETGQRRAFAERLRRTRLTGAASADSSDHQRGRWKECIRR